MLIEEKLLHFNTIGYVVARNVPEEIYMREYWVIDPLKKEARFYRLNDKKAYVLQEVEDTYISPLLTRLKIQIPIFWQDPLPKTIAVGQMVTKMLED